MYIEIYWLFRKYFAQFFKKYTDRNPQYDLKCDYNANETDLKSRIISEKEFKWFLSEDVVLFQLSYYPN